MNDNIHKTHFPVTKEMPWREKEKLAVILCRELILAWDKPHYDNYWLIGKLLQDNKELVDWVMKYKGE